MTTITQIISTAPDAPSRQDPTTFADKSDIFVGYIEGLDSELNTWASQVNTIVGEINTAITTTMPALIDDAEEQVSLATAQAIIATEQAELADADRETVALDKITVSQDRAYVADSRAYIEALTSIGFGLGIDSNGMLFTEIQEASNISDMTINSNGELIVTLES